MKTTLAAAFTLLATTALAEPYAVDTTHSTISFAGTHMGTPFKGTFTGWQATINFDKAKPETSTVQATFPLANASTGNPMFDGTLPQPDWFDAKAHPTGTFTSTSVAKTATAGTYAMEGNLTLKGITKQVSFTFVLADTPKGGVSATATVPVDRLAFGIGEKSDKNGEYVGKTVNVTLSLVASPVH